MQFEYIYDNTLISTILKFLGISLRFLSWILVQIQTDTHQQCIKITKMPIWKQWKNILEVKNNLPQHKQNQNFSERWSTLQANKPIKIKAVYAKRI